MLNIKTRTIRYKNKFIRDKKYLYLISFFVPIFILLCIYIARGTYPFGDRMYLARDMYHQYAPFFSELHNKLTNGGSLTYSWNIGLGTNFTGLYAYYLSSPINWLLALINRKHLIEFMNILIVFKIGLSSLTCTYYLRQHYKRKDLWAVAISLFYALSSYIAAYCWNIMWLDCMVLLPLILLGLERLVKENKGYLYCITLGISIISNYYISYMICMYIVLYFIILLFSNNTKKDWTYYKKRIRNFIKFSLLAGAVAAFLIIPEYFALKVSASGDINFPDSIKRYFSIYEILSRGLMTQEVSATTENDPNIYSSIIVYLLVPLYIIGQSKNIKEKIGKILLIAFFLISFNFNILNYIWHGFHFPNSLPARQSFIFIFLLLTMAYEVLININKFKDKHIYRAFFAALILFLSYEHLLVDQVFEYSVIYISILFLSLYLLILQIYRGVTKEKEVLNIENIKGKEDEEDIINNISLEAISESEDEIVETEKLSVTFNVGKQAYEDNNNLEDNKTHEDKNTHEHEYYYSYLELKKTSFMIIFLLIAIIEVFMNFGETGLSTTSRTYYVDDNADIELLLNSIEEDESFHRIEKHKRRTKNDAAWHGYKGVSLFSSTAGANLNDYLDMLGFENSMNAFSFYGQTPLTSSLFSVKYMLVKENDNFPSENSELNTLIQKSGEEYLYENNYTLPLGFILPSDFNEIWDTSSDNPFKVQNDFARNLVASKIFDEMTTISKGETITLKTDNDSEVYIYVPTRDVESLEFSVTDINGNEIYTETYDEYRREHILCLGRFEPDTLIHISSPESTSDIRVFAYTFNEEVFINLYKELISQPLIIESFEDTYIKGNIRAKEDGLIYTSIPYDKGWSVKIDGENVEPVAFKDALLAITLLEGNHTIELSYVPQGLYAGIVVSLIGLVSLILIIIKDKLQNRNKNNKRA